MEGSLSRHGNSGGCLSMEARAEFYSCKFETQCKRDRQFNAKNYSCRHGGGVSCRTWRNRTNQEISERMTEMLNRRGF
jgi:hypothetical protein